MNAPSRGSVGDRARPRSSASRLSDATTIHRRFEAQARATPDATALRFLDEAIVYAELDARADRLAALLRSRGVENGFVGVRLERSIAHVVATLGALKASCAVVPLPPAFPAARLREIRDFARLDAVVDEEGTPVEPGGPEAIVRLREGGAVARSVQSARHPPEGRPRVGAAAPAFVLSSSGSTGRPKLIVRSHGSFSHRLRWTWTRHPFAPGEVCVQKSHATTTHSIYELLEPLLRGVPVEIVPDAAVRQLETFWDAVREHRVSRLLLVPSLLQASLDLPGFVAPPLRVIVLMGEHVPSRLARRALDAFPPTTTVYSIYGSTEASSTLVCDVRASLRDGEELPLGRPIGPDVRALVLDDDLNEVAPGETGMLHVGGSALFSGYHRDDALTRSVLLERAGETLYRTQDRVLALEGGDMRFLGRADDVVKVRGFRVDPREVERVVADHPGVGQCAVLARGDDRNAGSLAAFVVPASVDPRELRRAVAERLPGHMVPSIVVALDALPLTPSGKLDRRRLLEHIAESPGPQGRNGDGGANADPPSGPTERLVARVWAEVLGVAESTLERESDFFEHGGTSLNVFVVVHRLRTALSLERNRLSDLALYRHPTVAGLSSYLDAARDGHAGLEPPTDAVLVTLKRGKEAGSPPLFLVSSAGGTLGAYRKLVDALSDRRDVIGIRDPFLWGDRDPRTGFDAWVGRYADAIVSRQREGPVHLVAYSSAGAFGWEIARRLREEGHDVGLLALVDPISLDRGSKRRFGYWALRARFARRPVTWALLLIGVIRRVVPGSILERGGAAGSGRFSEVGSGRLSDAEFEAFASEVRRDCGHLRRLAALLELNTGLPFGLDASEVSNAGPDGCLELFLNRVRAVAPEMDLETVEKIVVQYELQVRTQHRYRLRRYPGPVCLFEPEGPYRGLLAAQIRPFAGKLRTRGLAVGSGSERSPLLERAFPERIVGHFLCMRDDLFVRGLAAELEARLS